MIKKSSLLLLLLFVSFFVCASFKIDILSPQSIQDKYPSDLIKKVVPEIAKYIPEITYYFKNLKNKKKNSIPLPLGVIWGIKPEHDINFLKLLLQFYASYYNINFLNISAVDLYKAVQEGKRDCVAEIFEKAEKASPCIIFFYDIENIKQFSDKNVGQVLEEIVTHMQSHQDYESGIRLMATAYDTENMIKFLDDNHLIMYYATLPCIEGKILTFFAESYLQKYVSLDHNINLDLVFSTIQIMRLEGLYRILNKALFLAVQDNSSLQEIHLYKAIDGLALQDRRQFLDDIPLQHLEKVAYHESAHVLVSLFCQDISGVEVRYVHILSHIDFSGITCFGRTHIPPKIGSKEYYIAAIRANLAPLAAEEMIYGERADGSQEDLSVATDIAYDMVAKWGMASENMGIISYHDKAFISEASKQAIEEQVKEILKEQYNWVKDFLKEHKSQLDTLVKHLLQKHFLSGTEIKEIVGSL